MSFRLADGVLVSDELSRLDWLDHGFGTRAVQLLDTPGAAMLKQIHSDRCLVASAPGLTGEGDALISSTPGVAIGVKTADCVPILIADPVNRTVAAIHAGWRGTAAGIATRTVERMQREFNSRPADLIAAIGPSIGVCCFEVGPEVAEVFGKPAERTYLDLIGENRAELDRAGVRVLEAAAMCTKCANEPDFESFRRDGGASERMFSYIRIR